MHVAFISVQEPDESFKISLANRRCSVCWSDFLYMGSVKKEESQSVSSA